MSLQAVTEAAFQKSLVHADVETFPYRHWVLHQVLAPHVLRAILDLPFVPPEVGDTQGRRASTNSFRTFFSSENCRRFEACDAVAHAFQNRATVRMIERTCEVDLESSFLRIEYCQDRDGFWLEPHTDIGAKLFSMLLYLTDGPEDEEWGTDVFDGDRNFVKSVPFVSNLAMVFIPGQDTWHGFRRRPIRGTRRSLIINYVTSDWRSRDELAFPETPVYGNGNGSASTKPVRSAA